MPNNGTTVVASVAAAAAAIGLLSGNCQLCQCNITAATPPNQRPNKNQFVSWALAKY